MKNLFAVIAGLLLVGCQTVRSPVELTQLDSGSQINLKVGQILKVELPSNPTTGYNWTLTDTTESEPVLEKAGEPAYVKDEEAAGIVGIGGKETWKFRAIRAGWQKLRLEYKRPWEREISAEKTFVLDVLISE